LPLAISKAAEFADLKEYAVKEYPQKDSFEEKLIKMLSGDVETKMLKSYLGNNYNVFKTITDVEKLNFIQARMEYNLQIR
ncbi:MAG: signal peptide peptidase SppA, partial [Prevotellaceae bacterium]|jgi:protease-4|nr:signal peptide peptidase SppA [Prevotellaceae bacterium]